MPPMRSTAAALPLAAVLMLGLSGQPVTAAEIPAGAKGVLCSITELKRCEFESVCLTIDRDYIKAPAFIALDLAGKTAEGKGPGSIGSVNKLVHMVDGESVLIVQAVIGADTDPRDEGALAMAIERESGRGTLSAAGAKDVIVGSINCTVK